jgi:hypothetical protein
MKTEDLKPYPDNPRIHGDGEGLSKSILKYGDLSGVVFNIRNEQLVGGHYRVKTIHKDSVIKVNSTSDDTGTTAEGTITLPTGQRLNYREVDWDEQTHKEACIIANNEKIQGEWDIDLLDSQLEDLSIEMQDFEDLKLNELSGSEFGKTLIEEIPEKEEEIKAYKKTHILLSFSPEKFSEIKNYIEKIIKIEGIEYEQSSN